MGRKRQNRKGAAGRAIYPLLAFVLTAGFIIGTPPLSGEAFAVELDRACSLQVVSVEEGGNAAEGKPGKKVDLAVDLYLVAQAREVSGYDSYDYHVEQDSPYYAGIAAFAEAQEQQGWKYEEESGGLTFRYQPEAETGGWDLLAAEITAVTLTGEEEIAPVVTGEAGSRMENLEPGLYLMVARGSSLEGKDAYVKVDAVEGGQDISTVAYTDEFVYQFRPQLISLPTKEPEGGIVGTANRGEWLYALDGMELKFELDSRYTSLEIRKNIDRYAGSATFVFQVEARDGDRLVYSDIVSLSFDESTGTGKSVLLEEKIPAGSDVTVTEVYSGASYSLAGINAAADGEVQEGTSYTTDLTSGQAVITSISAGVTTAVTFTNDYNGSGNSGGAITNHFERNDEAAEWNWNQYQYNAVSGRWEWNGALPAVTDTTVR